MDMVNGTDLGELRPRYLNVPTRKGVGITLRCPREDGALHLSDFGPHCISLWFAKPDDDGPPVRADNLWLHIGTLEDPPHFSVYAPHGDPLNVEGHWRGWIIEGVVFNASGP